MNTKKHFMLLAAVLLGSVSAMAQSGNNEPLKGDVNEDGVVDVADIAAVIAIIKNNAALQTTYYWYVGATDPSTMTSISPIVTDTSSPGWREIGTTKPTSSTYTSSNMLWNGVQNSISFGSRVIPYIAVPYTPLQIWDSDGDSGLDVWTSKGTKDINNVTYYIYERNSKVAAFSFNIYNK